MLISFLKKGIYGYLREDQMGIYGFFSNNNLSFRRSAVEAAGGYDDSIRIAEDYDICQRIARAGWLLYYCPNVSLDHGARKTIRGLLNQWWRYGFHLAAGFKRYYPGKKMIAWKQPQWDDEAAPEPLRGATRLADHATLGRRFAVFIYLSCFALFHLSLIATLLAVFMCFHWAAGAGGIVSAVLLYLYARPDFSAIGADGLARAIQLFAIRYGVNFAFVLGGLVGGLSCGALYVFPAIEVRVGRMGTTETVAQETPDEPDMRSH